MTQVSRRPLSESIRKKVFSIFFTALASLSTASDIKKFLFDLLSPTEQTMLAKRLSIAILLEKGYSYETIKDILSVSQETIARVNLALQYRGEGYKIVTRNALNDEKLEELLRKVTDVTIAILPTSSIKKALQRQKNATRKPKTPLG